MLQELEVLMGADLRYDAPILLDGVPPTGGIAGWTFAFRIFAQRFDLDDAALLTLTSESGAITIFRDAPSDPADPACIACVRITKEQIAALGVGRFFARLSSLTPNADDDVPSHAWLIITR